jgi:hypothetical protein
MDELGPNGILVFPGVVFKVRHMDIPYKPERF